MRRAGLTPRALKARRDVLRQAIRTFTVEVPDDSNDAPNGLTELLLSKLEFCLAALPDTDDDANAARTIYNELCDSLADDTATLRKAAEAFFCEDFREP